MTSDQGGRYGEPAGRPEGGPEPTPPPGQDVPPPPPQGWNAPPPPQGWGAPPPPQGWNAPPHQGWQPQQWPGHGAPFAPPPPPGSAERPETVRFGVGAMLAALVLGVIHILAAFADLDTLVRETLVAADAPPDVEEEFMRSVLIGLEVFLLALGALFGLFLWFAWQGRQWARVVVLVMSGIYLVNLVSGISSAANSGFVASLTVFVVLLVIAGVVLLLLKPSQDWYRYMGWARTWGQAR